MSPHSPDGVHPLALWAYVFGNEHPVEVEISPGTGTFLLNAARRHPAVNFLAIEHSHSRAVRLEARVLAQQLPNARVLYGDAACVVATLIPSASVAAYHIYFPDPWWKRRHQRRRLFGPSFVVALDRTLVPGGCVYLATDVDEVYALMRHSLSAAGFVPAAGPPPAAPPSAFERKGVQRGATIQRATFAKPAPQPRVYTSSAAPITPAESPS